MIYQKWLLVCIGWSVSAIACAQVVECIDANGKKTYTQACPATTVKQRDVQPLPIVNSTPSGNNQVLKDKEKEFEKRRAERLKAEGDANDKAKKDKDDAQACSDAKKRLEVLSQGLQYKRVDPVTGEHVPMDEAQRQAEIDSLNAKIQDACKS